MLGKLVKLDLRFAYKKYLAMAALLIASGIFLPWIADVSQAVGIMGVFVIGFVVIAVLSIVLVFQSFSHNLFGTEGYLMHTLPVKPWQLVTSKLITTFVWFNLMVAAMLVMSVLMSRDEFVVFNLEGFQWAYLGDFLIAIAKAHLAVNIAMLMTVLSIYLGIAVSSVSHRGKRSGKLIGGIVGFAALWLAGLAIDWLSSKIYGGYSFDQGWWVECLLFAAFGALYFVVTTYLIGHKLNLR